MVSSPSRERGILVCFIASPKRLRPNQDDGYIKIFRWIVLNR